MRYDSGQFGSFEGLDNRKAVFRLLQRMGKGVSEEVACARRACFIQGLLSGASSPVVQTGAYVRTTGGMTPTEAYNAFIGITGVLNLDAEAACYQTAAQLEKTVRKL